MTLKGYDWKEFYFRRRIMLTLMVFGFTFASVGDLLFELKYFSMLVGIAISYAGLTYVLRTPCPRCGDEFFKGHNALAPLAERNCKKCGLKYKEI